LALEKIVEKKTVGSKGEIIPSKRLREKLELRPGALIEIRLEGRSLIVKPILDPLEELDGVLETGLSHRELKRIAELQVAKEAATKIAQQEG
jgi:bifunctional DNA-binding transcriptional regulator/antitoxin component of YhaV-PrlF toxin-antitoxin module